MKKIKVKGPIQKLISPAEFAKALGAEETNIRINTNQDPMSLFIAQCDASAEISAEDRAWLDSKPVGRELL